MSAEHKKMLEDAFLQCDNFQTLLGVYTGSASTLFLSEGGVFDTERALEMMDAFKARLQELLFAANMEGDTVAVDQYLNRFFRSK